MSKTNWFILGSVTILVLILVVFKSLPNLLKTKSTPTSTQSQVYKINVQNGKLQPPDLLSVSSKIGDTVNFEATLDEKGQIHFHNGENEIHQNVAKGVNNFTEKFTQAGNYSVEFHPGLSDEASASASPASDDAPGVELGNILVSP